MEITRRTLLKTGFAASASLILNDLALPAAAVGGPVDEKGVPSPVSPRQRLLLDFGWRFHLGHADDPAKDFFFGLPMVETTFAKAGQIIGHNSFNGVQVVPLQIDDTSWRIVDLPHDWAVELPFVEVAQADISAHAAHGGRPLGRGFPETSIGWYRRKFDVPARDEGMRITLEFDGVFRDAMIVFNGFYLGRNFSGYAPFVFDVTDYVNYGGENLLTLRVDATLGEAWSYEGAGIYRHVWLTKTSPLHLAKEGICVRSEMRENEALVSIETEILNEGVERASGRVISQLVDSSGKPVASVPEKTFEIPAGESMILAAQVSVAQPVLWSLEDPHLYRVNTKIESGGSVADQDETTFGIRTIRFDPDQGFFLNGKPVKIKGTCNHQDHAGVGVAVPDRIHFDRVATLKAMGSNGWRTAHNPVAPELLDACDRLGMLVMSETRLMGSSPEGLGELERMIRRDRNHPSIVIWSLANEEHYQGTPQGARIVASMKRLAHKLDPTRPVTAAMNFAWGQGVSAIVDVQGFNYWDGAKPGEPGGIAGNIDAYHHKFPRQPLIGSETSNGHGTRGVYADDPVKGHVGPFKPGCADCKPGAEIWWSAYDERAFLAGGFAWVGFDYRGEPKPYDHVSISSQSGVLDTCGFPKDLYHYYKAWWNPEPALHLFPHWSWDGKEGQDLDVWCYSNLDAVELFLNGRSLGSKSMVRNSHLHWTVKYEPGTIEARGYKDGQIVLTTRRETTGVPAKLALVPARREITADREDVCAIALEVHDAQGRVVPTASNKVSFKLTGPGRIIGVGNGDPSCHEADRPDSPGVAERSAFNGLCMVFVQATRQAGAIQIEASANLLTATKTEIQSKEGPVRPSVG